MASCEKDNSGQLAIPDKGPAPAENIIDVTGETDGDPKPMVLGELRDNPFSVEIVARADDLDYPTFGPINDAVTGFTNQQMFLALNHQVFSPNDFRLSLITLLPGLNGNTPASVDNLFNSY